MTSFHHKWKERWLKAGNSVIIWPCMNKRNTNNSWRMPSSGILCTTDCQKFSPKQKVQLALHSSALLRRRRLHVTPLKLLNVCQIHDITSQDSILCSHCKRMSHLTQKSGEMPHKQKVNTWHSENVLLPSNDVLNQAIFPHTQHTDHATIHLVSYQPPPVVDQVRYQGSSCMIFCWQTE